MASWPTGNDYSEAVQNPRTAFYDPELQAGHPETTPLGIPKPRSGAFATVFKMQCSAKNWAVRCFTKEVLDQRIRYEKISEHLKHAKLPYTVGFSYQANGIKIRGKPFPIVKMEWVQGESFRTYLEKNLNNSGAMISLSDRVLALSKALHHAQIAHGDLQHGNILVVAGDLKLVDYDCMFVPALSGLASNESGHRNYQHPKRTNEFGASLDNFSLWVLYASLRLLAVDPSIFAAAQKKSDEAIVFRKEDFDDPVLSETFREMDFAPDHALQKVASVLRSSLSMLPLQVPSLESEIGTSIPLPERIDSGWIKTHSRPASSASAIAPPLSIDASHGGPSETWIESHLPRLPLKQFRAPFLTEHVSVACAMAISVVTILFVPGLLVSISSVLGLSAILVFFLYGRYRLTTEFSEFAKLKMEQLPLRRETASISHMMLTANKKRLDVKQQYDKAYAKLREDLKQVQSLESNELAEWQMGLNTALVEIGRKKKNLELDETKKLDALRHSSRLVNFQAQRNSINAEEASQIVSQLEAVQRSHVETYMRGRFLSPGEISGIGPKLTGTLRDLSQP